MDSTSSSYFGKVIIPGWLSEVFITAVIAAIIGFFIWILQKYYEERKRKKADHEKYAKALGLALFELREAINRSISFADRFKNENFSFGVLYFSKTVASDFFKLYENLKVATEIQWLYALLNQIQNNLESSRLTNEYTRYCTSGSPMYYAGAAAGFADEYRDKLISKFNFCLRELEKYCKDNNIDLVFNLEMLD